MLCGGGEIGGVGGQIFFMNYFVVLGFYGFFVGGYVVMVEGVILGNGCDINIWFVKCYGVGDCVLGRVMVDLEYIVVLVCVGDCIGYVFGYDDVFVLFGDWQGCQCYVGRDWFYYDVGVVFGVGFFYQ